MSLARRIRYRLALAGLRESFKARFPLTGLNPVSLFDLCKVDAGDFSYGPLNVMCWNNPLEHLSIGRFVSVASEVIFMLGGNHDYRGLSTYPFESLVIRERADIPWTKGPIRVGDDVWIGQRATVLSGVSLGQGAIVGAGSVVTRNVEPYAIVAGNPAMMIKQRFSDEVVAELLTWADYSLIDARAVRRYRDLLHQEVTTDSIGEFREMFAALTAERPGVGATQ
jgi:acetyltransferase-like isoleucine patch superfamily enzyme